MPEGPGLGPAVLVALVVIALADVPMYLFVRAAARDGLGPNPIAGIRLRSLMRSPEAWRAGHVAALPAITAGAVVSAVAALLSVALATTVVPYIAVLALAIVSVVTGLGVGTVRAHRAAVRVHDARW